MAFNEVIVLDANLTQTVIDKDGKKQTVGTVVNKCPTYAEYNKDVNVSKMTTWE